MDDGAMREEGFTVEVASKRERESATNVVEATIMEMRHGRV